MIIICLKYTSLIKIIETTTLARWSGTHPLRTVWQSTDRGKYKIMFKNKFRQWEKVILDLVVSQSFRNLKETVSRPLSSFSLWLSSPGNVVLPVSTQPGQRTTCCSLPWTTTLLRSYQMICRYPEDTRTSLQNKELLNQWEIEIH